MLRGGKDFSHLVMTFILAVSWQFYIFIHGIFFLPCDVSFYLLIHGIFHWPCMACFTYFIHGIFICHRHYIFFNFFLIHLIFNVLHGIFYHR